MRSALTKSSMRVQTTVRLPRSIYERAKSLAGQGPEDVNTFNDVVVAALAHYLGEARRRQIDRAFEGMAGDQDYQRTARLIEAEFSASDWEAFQTAESDARRR